MAEFYFDQNKMKFGLASGKYFKADLPVLCNHPPHSLTRAWEMGPVYVVSQQMAEQRAGWMNLMVIRNMVLEGPSQCLVIVYLIKGMHKGLFLK